MSMASRIASLRGSLSQMGLSSGLNPHKVVKELMEKNKEFVVSDPQKAAILHKQLFYTYLDRYVSIRLVNLCEWVLHTFNVEYTLSRQT